MPQHANAEREHVCTWRVVSAERSASQRHCRCATRVAAPEHCVDADPQRRPCRRLVPHGHFRRHWRRRRPLAPRLRRWKYTGPARPLPLPPPTSSVPACTPGFRPLRPLPPPPPAAAALAVSTSVPPLPRSISGLGSPLWVAAGPGLFVRVAWPALPLERDGASDPAAAAFCPHLDCEGVEAPNCETAAAPTAAKAPPPMPPPPSPSPAPPPAALAERGRRLPPRCPRACCFATACGVPGGSSAASLPSP